ncbi:DUF6675 family protein [Sediminispirochaeta smaragdinae]|uniref:Uncharacterized protein n=1 Tax=Sediminispirochaeta smaragdinae (strain DSM 11293 / JCM 15392 / SEBR 4228) TaxID=573413 RepID=E1RA04_SEDSS|nr:DUF6675 family protein [Sediminispirochaeta smaragdinae]ADK83323.1 hypothetical protein Spirs_4249 [Sediminispirochaeta smaragdinae DSM 11293]
MKQQHINIGYSVVFFSLILFLAMGTPLFAVPFSLLSDHPDGDYPLHDTIRWEEGEIPILTLLPDVPGADALRERFFDYRPEVTVQKLYRIKLPAQLDLSDRELFTAVVNVLGTPETQVGYTYHSSRRDEDVVLFEETYISDKKGKRKDSFSYTPEDVPQSISYYQYVDEANFSGTVLKEEIEVGDDFLSFRSTNIERMWYAIVPVLKAGGTRSEMLMFTADGYLYVYSASQVEEEPGARKLGVPIHLPSMFGKRMDVMATWVEDQLMKRLK